MAKSASTQACDIEPLYIKNWDIPTKDLKPFDICNSAAKVVGKMKVDGAQPVKARNGSTLVWKLYLKDEKTRVELYTKQKIMIDGKVVQIYDEYPIMISRKREQKMTKSPLKMQI